MTLNFDLMLIDTLLSELMNQINETLNKFMIILSYVPFPKKCLYFSNQARWWLWKWFFIVDTCHRFLKLLILCWLATFNWIVITFVVFILYWILLPKRNRTLLNWFFNIFLFICFFMFIFWIDLFLCTFLY